MLTLLNLLTFAWLAYWCLRAFRLIAGGARHPILAVLSIHFAFSGLPLLWDVLIGLPDYPQNPGFGYASTDAPTLVIYCLYVSLVPVFLWFWSGAAKQYRTRTAKAFEQNADDFSFLQPLRPLMVVFLVSPLVAAFFAPNPRIYLSYASVLSNQLGLEDEGYHGLVSLTTFLSVLGGIGLFAAMKKIRIRAYVLIVPFFFPAIWLNGKRSIIAYTIVLVGYLLWQKGILIGKRLAVATVFSVLLIGTISYQYQRSMRNMSSETMTSDDLYTSTRIDFGRDAQTKMAIYAELHPNIIQILEYRGESLLFKLTMYVPRELWVNKPYPYAQYFTSAMLMKSPRLWGWGMTTSWLDEAIANFSWLGLVLGPLVLALICRRGEYCKNNFVSVLTSIVASFALSVDMVAFAPLFIIWVLTLILMRPSKRRMVTVSSLSPRSGPQPFPAQLIRGASATALQIHHSLQSTSAGS